MEPPAAACVAVSQMIECVDDNRACPNDGQARPGDDDDAEHQPRPLGDRRRQSEQRARQHGEQEPGPEGEGTVQRLDERGQAFIALLERVPPPDILLQPHEPATKHTQRDENRQRGGRERAGGQRECSPGLRARSMRGDRACEWRYLHRERGASRCIRGCPSAARLAPTYTILRIANSVARATGSARCDSAPARRITTRSSTTSPPAIARTRTKLYTDNEESPECGRHVVRSTEFGSWRGPCRKLILFGVVRQLSLTAEPLLA